MTLILLALAAGVLIGLSLGVLGGGGSILAVPAFLLLGQSPVQATTGSLVVVGVSALVGAVAAARAGTVLVGRGLAFGIAAVGGAVLGGKLSLRVPEQVLLLCFAGLLLVITALLVVRDHRSARAGAPVSDDAWHAGEPLLQVAPTFRCDCPRALVWLLAATGVGLLTGFLGVGGGFLVVPALVLALGVPQRIAGGTSLVVIAVTSATALAVRGGAGAAPDWPLVAVLAATAAVAALAGVRLAGRVDTRLLSRLFAALLVVVAVGVTAAALP